MKLRIIGILLLTTMLILDFPQLLVTGGPGPSPATTMAITEEYPLRDVAAGKMDKPRTYRSQAGIVVVVRPGDTLWNLVRAYGPPGIDPRIAIYRVQEANQLESILLQPGQMIVIPDSVGD